MPEKSPWKASILIKMRRNREDTIRDEKLYMQRRKHKNYGTERFRAVRD